MNPHPFTIDEVMAIHSAVIAKFGGANGVRDEGLLESALAQPFQSFAGIDLYPSIEAKASRYAFGIIKDHPFIDGNKRTATALMGAFLRLSGRVFRPGHAELLDAMLAVAEGAWGFDDLKTWVESVID